MNSIPASQLVSVQPGVVGTGGSPLSLNSIFLTQDAAIPIGTVQPFPTADSVAKFFGATSPEALLSDVYFLGFDGSNIKPGNLFFAQYPVAGVPAYLRGGSVSAMTLDQLKALSGVLTITQDGVEKTSSSINMSTATSFDDAAAKITAGFATNGPTASYDSLRKAFVLTSPTAGAGADFTGAISTTTLTVSAVASGTLQVGQVISGVGVTAGTYITAFGTGTGGAGTYTVSASQTVASEAMTANASSMTVASGTLSAGLYLTTATGALLSQGAAAAVPATFMDAAANVTQNWACFMTVWEPLIADKLAFADWTNAQNQRFSYVCWDSDITATQSGNTTAFGPQCIAANYNGIVPVYPVADKAAFICGMAASIDFNQTNGRITFAYKGQAGLTADVTDPTTATNLEANGYNFYGAYATANQSFTFLQPGSTPGVWKWIDGFINQVYLNSQFQLALMELLSNTKSLPYNSLGYGMIIAALMDPINQGLNFGSIRAGVPLSSQQAASVNMAAGVPIDKSLTNQGYYLQVLPATAQVRGLRQTPPCTFWYMDGGSIQKINLASLDVQ